jgi:hypothetical protein
MNLLAVSARLRTVNWIVTSLVVNLVLAFGAGLWLLFMPQAYQHHEYPIIFFGRLIAEGVLFIALGLVTLSIALNNLHSKFYRMLSVISVAYLAMGFMMIDKAGPLISDLTKNWFLRN